MLMYCPVCYEKISIRALSCPKCGTPIDEDVNDYDLQQELSRRVVKKTIVKILMWIVLPIAITYIIFYFL